MALSQVYLNLNEMGLEVHPCFVGLCLGLSGAAVFLKFTRLHEKAIGNSYEMAFGDRLACRIGIVDALVETHIEALEWFVRIEGFS